MSKIKKLSRRTKIITIVVFVILIFAALYNGPVTRNYNLESNKVNNTITIAVAADLHSQYFGEHQEKIIDRIKKSQPDIILMPGDMTNSPYDSNGMIEFMQQAVNIAPCYYVLGNHEYWSMEHDKILNLVKETGVTILRNEQVTLNINENTIELYGMDDWDANYYDDNYIDKDWATQLNNLWTENDKKNYRILMTHRPEKVEYYTNYEYDLIVAGHSHGGQGRIPFILNGLYAPDQGYFPKYAGGKYELSDATTMIVSRGLYNYKYMPRIFNPSEIVIISVAQNN